MRPRLAGRLHDGVALGCVALALVVAACSGGGDSDAAAPSTTAPAESTSTTAAPVVDIEMTPDDFKALGAMTPVRGFFVDNVLGDLEATVAVAESADGGVYPVGSVVQLVPGEAMVKRAPGFSPEAGDWEFFELAVSAEGTEITNRGGAEVVNRFGGSCSACHMLAEPQWDFICEQDHGCDPLPIAREIIELGQDADPRPVPGG